MMQGSFSVWLRTFTSPACVHAIDSSADPSHRSAMASTKKTNKTVTKFLLLLKPRWRICQAFKSPSSRGARAKIDAAGDKDGSRENSDADTFVSAISCELRSVSTDDTSDALPSFRLSPLIIFPTVSISRPPPASPVKIIQKLPFGFVIGRQEDAAELRVGSIRKGVPVLQLIRSRSQVAKKKFVRAVKGTFRRGGNWRGRRGGGEEEVGDGCGSDEHVFWKKEVKGLRCRRVEDEDTPY